jgi:hypothetical protein
MTTGAETGAERQKRAKNKGKENGKPASLPFFEISQVFLVEQRRVELLASALRKPRNDLSPLYIQ